MGPPSVISGIVWFFSKKNLALVELITPTMLLSIVFSKVLIHVFEVTGPVSSIQRLYTMFFWIFGVWIQALFIKATWLRGFIIREALYMPVILALLYNRKAQQDEDFIFGQGIVNSLLAGFFIEVTVYDNAKKTALLFARL